MNIITHFINVTSLKTYKKPEHNLLKVTSWCCIYYL